MKVFGFLTVLAVSTSLIGCMEADVSKDAAVTTTNSNNLKTEKIENILVNTNTSKSLFSEMKENEVETEVLEKTPIKKSTPKIVKAKPAKKLVKKKPFTKAAKVVAIQKDAMDKIIETPETSDEVQTTQSSTSSTNTTTTELDTAAVAKKKKTDALAVLDPSLAGGRKGFRGQLGISANTDFKETSDETKNYYSQFTLNLFYDLEGGNNIGLFIPMQKDLSGEFEEKFFLDSRLSYAQNGLYKSENLIFNMRYGFLYPTTETSKVRDEMIAGLELNPTLIFPLSKLVNGLTFIYIPRYRKRFHRFTTNRAGESLVTDSLLNIMVANYAFAEKWYFSSTLLHVASQRYDGARTDDSYLTVQEIGYQYNAQMVFTMGIMQGGNVINRQYGEDDSIEVFDANSSEFYTGFNYAF
jgi:hypothetical protein